jgi:hypothetical protein
MGPTSPLLTVVFIEGKPQRPHRRLVAPRVRTLVLRSFVVNSVVEKIPGRLGNWFNISGI